MNQQFTITYEVTEESRWSDNSSGLLSSIEAAESSNDSDEVAMMVWQAAHAGRLRAVEVKRVEVAT